MISGAMIGEVVTLRPWTATEADLYLALRDNLVFRFTTESRHLAPGECRRNIDLAQADPTGASFAICDPAGHPVGNLDVSRSGSRVTMSYWLAPTARGRGWAADALRTASAWAWETWDVDYLELEIDPENEASIFVARAAGYRRHGLRLESACGGPAILYRVARKPG